MERNLNWEEVEYKVSIICRKFSNIDKRFRDDLAQELRIHAYYKSDDYYDLQRKAIDYWRSLRIHVMPEVPYFDLEMFGGVVDNNIDIDFYKLVHLLKDELRTECRKKFDNKIRVIAEEILEIILADIDEESTSKKEIRQSKYSPYHNRRISASYLWDVLGDHPGDVEYVHIRKAIKFLESIIIKLHSSKKWEIDERYLKD